MTGSTYSPASWTDLIAANVKTAAKGISALCTAGQPTNIDLILTDDQLIRGIEFYSVGQVFGDTVTIQIIDTNGVTGVQAGTVVATPVTNWNIPTNESLAMKYDAAAPMKALATFTLRAIYTSTGLAAPVQVGINYLMLQPKV